MVQTLNNCSVQTTFNSSSSVDLVLGSASNTLSKTVKNTYANGSGNNQANRSYGVQLTIAADGSSTIDLSGGLANPLNGNEALSAVKELILVANQNNPGDVVVGGNANGFESFISAEGTLVLPPGGMIHLSNQKSGYAVTAGTGDILEFANADLEDACIVEVYIVGVLAV